VQKVKLAYFKKIQYGGRPPYWKSKTCNNSAAVHPFMSKLCMNKQIVTPNREEGENLHILKIQNET